MASEEMQLGDEIYYHGVINRSDCNELLRKNGDFLLRYGNVVGFHTPRFILSVMQDEQCTLEGGGIKHYLVRSRAAKLGISSICFDSLPEMIEHYMCTGHSVAVRVHAPLLTPISKARPLVACDESAASLNDDLTNSSSSDLTTRVHNVGSYSSGEIAVADDMMMDFSFDAWSTSPSSSISATVAAVAEEGGKSSSWSALSPFINASSSVSSSAITTTDAKPSDPSDNRPCSTNDSTESIGMGEYVRRREMFGGKSRGASAKGSASDMLRPSAKDPPLRLSSSVHAKLTDSSVPDATLGKMKSADDQSFESLKLTLSSLNVELVDDPTLAACVLFLQKLIEKDMI